MKRIRIPIQREEIEEGARNIIELKSPFLVDFYEGFWETLHGPYEKYFGPETYKILHIINYKVII